MVRCEEIKYKVEKLLGDRNFRGRALNMKESAMNCVREGGSSYNNLQRFIQWLKPQGVAWLIEALVNHSLLF